MSDALASGRFAFHRQDKIDQSPMDLPLTIALLAGEIAIFVACLFMQRRKRDPLRPRIIPYNLIGMLMMVMALATLAHIISLVTGNPVVPRSAKF